MKESKVTLEKQNQYLDKLNDPSFQGVNRLLFLSFENNDNGTGGTNQFFQKVQINDCNVMVEW